MSMPFPKEFLLTDPGPGVTPVVFVEFPLLAPLLLGDAVYTGSQIFSSPALAPMYTSPPRHFYRCGGSILMFDFNFRRTASEICWPPDFQGAVLEMRLGYSEKNRRNSSRLSTE